MIDRPPESPEPRREPRGDPDDLPPIQLRDSRLGRAGPSRPWSRRLLYFVRAVAAVECLKGLWHWAALLGFGGDPFAGASVTGRVATVFFAVADPVAAVGLWLGAAWGVVIWLLAASAQLLVEGLEPHGGGLRWLVTLSIVAAMAGYLALSLKAKSEDD
ncbi:DUF6163 family protein [Methylopila sp. Yamaguchi]|uniref:DUF6163 family protein n=1 Tax=Methylopila sp. Yamaguchi TaxID=1437817 RepID=UPI000CB5D5EE|nr:DUF6163 family protein [Methylopila sp. Yamaguchi]GBD49042.1 hypothetical protein METY_2255 [Methylopila sp. Yamaguchi]